MDISDTLAPASEQLDAIDLLGAPRTFTVAEVTRNNGDQPINVKLIEFPRVWRPGKSMRRVLAFCWGKDASQWVGRRVTLYCDENVRFGNDVVGGTRIRALSHIDGPKRVPLLISKGRSAIFTVQPLVEEQPPAQRPQQQAKPIEQQIADAVAHFGTKWKVTQQQLEALTGAPSSDWTPAELATLRALDADLASGKKTVAGEFPEREGQS